MVKYLKIIMIILIEIFSISIITHYEVYKKKIDLKKIKKFTCFINILKIIAILILILFLIIQLKKCYDTNLEVQKQNEEMQVIKLKIDEEMLYFQKNKNNYTYSEPYILEGFKYVEGTMQTGFVIEDEKKNQYVWVPCNNENILDKYNFSEIPLVSYNECYDEEYKEFINSVLNNGGFYISRYEIGKEKNDIVSKKGIEILNDCTVEEAKKIVSLMYNDSNFKCEIINGFAYDTALNWIFNNNNDIVLKEENTNKNLTGKQVFQNIYDLLDDNFELTLERSYDNTIVFRGVFYDDSFFKKHIGIQTYDNRWLLPENNINMNFALRTILYKK